MNTRLVNTAADVILRALTQNRTAAGIALALESAQLLQSPETAAETERLRARLDEVHRVPQDNVTPAEVRLGQYAQPPRTFASDTERAMFQIACGLRDTLEETRDQRNAARLLVAGLKERIAELEAELYSEQAHGRTLLEQRNAHAQELLKLRPALREARARVTELEAAPTTVYRAEHPDSGITLGHYDTEVAARAHCEATERRSWPTGTTLAFDWIEDDEDRVAELVVTAGQNEESTTGYIVTALELDSEYDPDGDE